MTFRVIVRESSTILGSPPALPAALPPAPLAALPPAPLAPLPAALSAAEPEAASATRFPPMPQHRSATSLEPANLPAACRAVSSEDACSSPALVNSIRSARANLARAATRSACWVSAAATSSAGYSARRDADSASARSGLTSSPASRPSNSRPVAESSSPPVDSVPLAPTIGYMSPDFTAYGLSEEHDALRESVRQLADDKIAPYAAEVDEQARFPQEALDALTRADLHAVHIPEAYGGAGADAIATAIVIEEVARACASSSLIPAVNKLGTVPLLLAGSPGLNQRYLAPVARGEAMFSYALSEPEAGSDAAAMRTRAVSDGDSFILNGTKRWITNAGISRFYTVMAVTEPEAGQRGVSAFVVERDDPGFSFGALEHKLGIKGSPTRELYFDNCVIPADRMIGEEGSGFRTALATLDHTRITIAAQALGIAQGALDYAAGYVRERKQFGQAIAEFQGIQFMLADMAMKVEAARQLTYAAAGLSERAMAGEKVPSLTFVSAAAKCLASDTAMAVTTDAVQLLGGYGYTRDFPVERMMRDAKITQIYEGTNQVQRMVMARQLLKG